MSQRTFLSTSRWLRVIAVVILLAMSAGAAPIRAQGALHEVKLIRPAQKIICQGESVPYTVAVWRTRPLRQGDAPESLLLPIYAGDTLSAESTDSSVGEFRGGRYLLSNSPSDELSRPQYIEFTFVAKEPGRTTLIFSATVNGTEAISDPLDVRVQPCKFTVFAKSQWSHADSGYTLAVVAMTTRIEMVIDNTGRYVGGGEVVYLSASSSIAGHGVVSMAQGIVSVTGSLDENNQLVVRLIYGPTTLSQTSEGLDYSVPVEVETLNGFLIYSSGSVFTGGHEITVNGVPIGGSAQIILIVKKQK